MKANQPNSPIPPPPPNVVPPIIPIQTIPSTPKSNIPTQMPTAPSKQPHQFINPEPTSFQPHFDNIDQQSPSSSKSHQKPTPKPTRASTRLRIPTQKYFHDDLHLFNSTKEFFSKDTYSCDFNQLFLSSMSWLPFSTKSDDCKAFFSAMETSIDPESNTIEYLHPLALQTMANAEDTPTYEQAINGPYAKEFHKAMQLEFTTLNENIDSWDIIDYEPHMNVLSSTWSFKVKRYPDGSIKKLKARFCVRGYEQIEGVDYFDTYAPVVSWTTVRLLLVLSIVLNLFTCQVDYTAAFAQAPVTDDIYVEMPRGFKQPGKVLKLKRSLYGLKQSSRNWFQHLQQGLKRQGFVPSTNDPCLFIHPKVICLTYVDDCLFFAKSTEDIHNMINSLRADKFSIQMEDDFAGYLGVLISHNDDGSITLTQTGLINRIIEAAHLSDSTPKYTPADVNALPQDLKGLHYSGSFNYASIVGMLNYLANNTRPDIAFAVHQCARYTFDPKASHEIALKRIVRYLCATKDRGFVINRPQHLNVDCYVDADFAGLWNLEDRSDPHSVKSRTGFVILVGDIPIIWKSSLQTEIALSTFEAEYVALSTAMRDVLPFQNLFLEVTAALKIKHNSKFSFKTFLHEDNSSAEKLAKLEFPRITPRSKHFGVKYHWFRTKLKPNNVDVIRVDSKQNIADIFTKGLVKNTFEHLRQKLLGW